MGSGLIISETEPELINRYTWCKPLPDGSKEWYEPSDEGWVLTRTDAAPATSDHAHATHGDINFTGNIQADGYDGLNDRVTIGTKRLTFKEGICIAAEDV